MATPSMCSTTGRRFTEFRAPRLPRRHTHGSGDTLAASITCALARGADVPAAVRFGKWFVTGAVENSFALGSGVGPVGQFWRVAELPAEFR